MEIVGQSMLSKKLPLEMVEEYADRLEEKVPTGQRFPRYICSKQ
jgi:hypothetical protein